MLKDGDLLKVDTACKYNGWCADRAITIPVGTVRPERLRLLKVAEDVLQLVIDELPRRKWWSEIASRMQKHVESSGYSVVTQYVGHGIGRTMHENPQVPNFVNRETRKNDFKLEPGLVLAVEPMVNMGKEDVKTLHDHWTVVTKDGMPSVHVEHTLAIGPDGKVVIITSDDGAFDGWTSPVAAPGAPVEAKAYVREWFPAAFAGLRVRSYLDAVFIAAGRPARRCRSVGGGNRPRVPIARPAPIGRSILRPSNTSSNSWPNRT